MNALLLLVVPAYLAAMALAVLGLAAAIIPARIRRRREGSEPLLVPRGSPAGAS